VNLFTPAGTAANTIAVDITDITLIAASQSSTSLGDNSNAVALARLVNANTMSGGTATFSNYYNSLVAQVGLDVNAAQSVVSQDNAFLKQLSTLRDSNSGVSLDEELTDLIKYQRSYQASAKLITTVDSMMETLINMI
jgi:flagellar hook-associated protein 1 FlgK